MISSDFYHSMMNLGERSPELPECTFLYCGTLNITKQLPKMPKIVTNEHCPVKYPQQMALKSERGKRTLAPEGLSKIGQKLWIFH